MRHYVADMFQNTQCRLQLVCPISTASRAIWLNEKGKSSSQERFILKTTVQHHNLEKSFWYKIKELKYSK